MKRRSLLALALLPCLGCSPPQGAPSRAVDPTPMEAIRPAGAYGVGVTTGPRIGRALETRLYYPAGDGGSPDAGAMTAERRAGLTRRFGLSVAEALDGAVTQAQQDAPPAAGRFPLVIFQPGAGMAALDYRLLIEALASRGYVVLALNVGGSPAASGSRYDAAAEELLAALALARSAAAALPASADLSRVAFVGHSLGGAGSVLALARAPGVTAVNLDGDLPPDSPALVQPSILYLFGQTPGEADRSRQRRARLWRAVSGGSEEAEALQVATIRHFDFADAAVLQSGAPDGLRAARFGAIGGARAQALVADLVGAFLDSRLKGDGEVWARTRARYPEAAAPTTW